MKVLSVHAPLGQAERQCALAREIGANDASRSRRGGDSPGHNASWGMAAKGRRQVLARLAAHKSQGVMPTTNDDGHDASFEARFSLRRQTMTEHVEEVIRQYGATIGKTAYVVGIVLFVALIVPLTDPSCTGPCYSADAKPGIPQSN